MAIAVEPGGELTVDVEPGGELHVERVRGELHVPKPGQGRARQGKARKMWNGS